MVEQVGDQTKLAKRLGTTQPTVSRWIDGAEPKSHHERRILQLANKLRIINHSSESAEYTVQKVGYVGAGGEVLYSEGQGPFGEAEMPPEGKTPLMVAVEVRGDSMAGLLGHGSIIYYDNRREPPTDELFGKLCVVGLADGRVLVKRLLRGRNGLYDLYSLAAVPLLDQAVTWAARVSFIRPE
jgi:phage repressor protein C with HTH and peptisase S24 domain